MKNQDSLRVQFIKRIFLLLISIALLSGGVQLFIIKKEITNNVESQAALLSQSIEKDIYGTNVASKAIEYQIDLKMVAQAQHISSLLGNKKIKDITDEELANLKNQFHLTGLTLLSKQKDDIVAEKSTEENEIGFSFKQFGPFALDPLKELINEEKISGIPGNPLKGENYFVLPISQSGSHQKEPLFFKYAYYHAPGTDYILNPYIEEKEVYQFTEEVGPDKQIKEILSDNPFVEEIAVLNPRVFADPSLEKELYPPLKKIEYGTFKSKNKEDQATIEKLDKSPQKISYFDRYEGEKVYKTFLPISDSKVIYIAFNYGELSEMLYKHSIILVIFSLISLLAMFLLTARFFTRIYENIQKIINQIKNIEKGDLTAKSNINDGSELGELSRTANRMVDKLNELLADTQVQAQKTQLLSTQLEKEASQSVDRMYTISTEATMKSRDQLHEIGEFLDETLRVLELYDKDEHTHELKESIEQMRQIALDRTSSVTETTLTLSDLVQSLHKQSSELSVISQKMIHQIDKFTL